MKKLLALALALLMLAMPILTSCDPKQSETEATGTQAQTEAPTTGNQPGDQPVDPAKTTYTVEIQSVGGLKMSGVNVYVYKDKTLDDMDGFATTDENGVATFSLTKNSTYHVTLTGIPDGYELQESYALDGTATKITLTSRIIPTPDSSASYELGSVMHDFTVTTIDGHAVKLSDILKDKKAVVLNFWYVGCSWCRTEFPYMQSAYEQYKDDLEIIAINPLTTDTDMSIKLFVQELGLTFPITRDTVGLTPSFEVDGYPTSVVIDRYGVVCMIERGAITSEKPFIYIFDHFTKDNYEQKLITKPEDVIPEQKPTGEMPSSEEISKELNKGEITVTYRPETDPGSAEYSWPFLIGEKNGEKCIYPSNKEADGSFAIIYADVTMKKNDVLAFDYFASCENSEAGADILYVLVDGKDIYQIAGESDSWKTCFSFVAPEDGTYELALCYMKDESVSAGDDTVYIKDLRITSINNINIPTYIPRFCATNMSADGMGYQDYAEVVYNEKDGYYHVGSENGPLLLVDLMKATRFSSDSIYMLGYNGKITLKGVNYYEQLLPYFSLASNSELGGICTVNKELMELLKIVAEAVGLEAGNDKQWLQMCSYYDAYGTDGVQLADPIRGLCNASAFPTTEGKDNPNTVTYNRVIMPRGLKYKFVPTKSGAYRITSDSKVEVDGWIFLEDGSEMYVYEGGERLYNDPVNLSMVVYMEAGQSYYIDIAYYDVYQQGTFTFTVEYVAPEYDHFTIASPGFFTYYESENISDPNDIIAGGIDVILGDDGYYHEKRADGSIGSVIYADFTNATPIFNKTIQEMIAVDGFNFSMSETDHEMTILIDKYGKANLIEKLKELWGDSYEENYELYRVDDVLAGKYHGRGEDLTDEISKYLEKMIPASAETPELTGCVPVDENLKTILWKLMDKYTFSGVENSWLKVCYYYQYLGPVATPNA